MLFYVPKCPNCHKPIHEPFSRLSGPIAYVHKPEGPRKGCRLIITPTIGGDPSIRVIPWTGIRLEDELAREIAAFNYGEYWKSLGLEAA